MTLMNLMNENETVDMLLIMLFMKEDIEAICFQYSGCSEVGFDRSTHYRYVQVDTEHLSSKELLHTLFHILGRYHEHERSDREKYVDVIEKNIIEGTILKHILVHIHIYMYN